MLRATLTDIRCNIIIINSSRLFDVWRDLNSGSYFPSLDRLIGEEYI